MSEQIRDVIQKAKTFQIYKWHYRSNQAFNPYILASQGYQCEQLNVLQCSICHNRVQFGTREGTDRPTQQILDQLQNHDRSCIYFQEQPHKFTKPQLYLRMDDLIKNVKQSHQNLQNQKNYFPLLNYKKFIHMIAENNQTKIFEMILSRSNLNSAQIKISYILTLLGWARLNSQQLKCQFCGRRIDIKDYKKTNQDKQSIDLQNQEQKTFDIFDQHRYFCFWVHGQNAWEIYIQHLFDKLGQAEQLFRNKDPQDVKKIRVLIDSYLQNFKSTTIQNFQKINKIMDQCNELAEAIEQQQQNRQQYRKKSELRRQKMQKFLSQIETDMRKPLKMIKID